MGKMNVVEDIARRKEKYSAQQIEGLFILAITGKIQ